MKKGMNREVSMLDESNKNKEVCRMQFTIGGLPKLVFSKPIMALNGNYSA